jgi:hypothetical protein
LRRIEDESFRLSSSSSVNPFFSSGDLDSGCLDEISPLVSSVQWIIEVLGKRSLKSDCFRCATTDARRLEGATGTTSTNDKKKNQFDSFADTTKKMRTHFQKLSGEGKGTVLFSANLAIKSMALRCSGRGRSRW